jgi:hypothetical protein
VYENSLPKASNLHAQLVHLIKALTLRNDLMPFTPLASSTTHVSRLNQPVHHREHMSVLENSGSANLHEFYLRRCPSTIAGASQGLFVHGTVPKHTVMCVYPGVLYETMQGDPMSFASVRNPYFLHASGFAVDGCPFGYSAFVYRSVSSRNGFTDSSIGRIETVDTSWLGKDGGWKEWLFSKHRIHPTVISMNSPLSTGHLVNHHTVTQAPNAIYAQVHIDLTQITAHQRMIIPNVNFSSGAQNMLSCVVLVSVSEIDASHGWVEMLTDYHMIAVPPQG